MLQMLLERWRALGEDRVRGVDRGLPPEGVVPGQKLVEHYPEREQVGTCVDRLGPKLFR